MRRPGAGTRPGVFYRGAGQATLDPLAARRPDGGLYASATSAPGRLPARSHRGIGGRASSSAAALISYDVAHQVPWGWRVSLYTWTKSIAAGSFLAMVLVILVGRLSWSSPLARYDVPGVALAFLGRHRGVADLRPHAPVALLPALHTAGNLAAGS